MDGRCALLPLCVLLHPHHIDVLSVGVLQDEDVVKDESVVDFAHLEDAEMPEVDIGVADEDEDVEGVPELLHALAVHVRCVLNWMQMGVGVVCDLIHFFFRRQLGLDCLREGGHR